MLHCITSCSNLCWQMKAPSLDVLFSGATCENALQLSSVRALSETDHSKWWPSRAALYVTRRCCGAAILRSKPPSHAILGETESERMHMMSYEKDMAFQTKGPLWELILDCLSTCPKADLTGFMHDNNDFYNE